MGVEGATVRGAGVIHSLTCMAYPSSEPARNLENRMWPSSLPSRLESPCEIPPPDDTHHRRARGRIGHDRDRADPMVHHECNCLDCRLDGIERDDARAHDGTDRGYPRVLDRRDERSVREQVDLEEVCARYEADEPSGVGDDGKAVVVVLSHQIRQRLDAGLWSHRDDRSGHQITDRDVHDLPHGIYLLARQRHRSARIGIATSPTT